MNADAPPAPDRSTPSAVSTAPSTDPMVPPGGGPVPPVPPASPSSPAALPRRRTGRAWSLALVALAVLPLLVLAAVLALPFTAGGTAWLLGALPPASGVRAEGAEGALLRGPFRLGQLRWQMTPQRHLEVHNLRWSPPQLGWQDGAPRLAWAELDIDRIALVGPGSGQPIVLPPRLVLPLAVAVQRLGIARIDAPGLLPQPVLGVSAGLALGAGPAAGHALSDLALRWDGLAASGEARLGAAAPLPLQARLALRPVEGGPDLGARLPADWADWQMAVRADGPLADLVLQASLRSAGPQLDARARLRLEAPWPLPELDARLSDLDLRRLASTLPQTRLSGTIDLQLGEAVVGEREPRTRPATPGTPGATAAPATLALRLAADLRNDAAGPWSAGRVPARSVRLSARSDARNPRTGRLDELAIELGEPARPAGQISGSGQWQVDAPAVPGQAESLRLSLDARLQDLRPAELDRRAPPLQVSGPLAWTLDTRPGPGTTTATAARPSHWLTTVKTDLRGSLIGAGLPAARVQLDAALQPQLLKLTDLRVETGNARLSAQGQLSRGEGAWGLRLNSELHDVDPGVWLPAHGAATLPLRPPEDSTQPGSPSPLQRLLAAGRTRLDGSLQLDLQVPRTAALGIGRIAQLQGQGELTLMPSLLAGQPLSGHLMLKSSRVDVAAPMGRTRSPPLPAPSVPANSADTAAADDTRADLLPGVPVPADLPRLLADLSLQLGPGPTAAERRSGADHATLAALGAPGGAAPAGLALQAHGELDPVGAQDRWRLAWRSGDLAGLQPWLKLLAPAVLLPAPGGRIEGEAEVQGRWPAIRSRGQIDLPRLTLDAGTPAGWSAREARLAWRFGSQPDDVLELDALLSELRQGRSLAQGLRLSARGTSADHRVSLDLARVGSASARTGDDAASAADTGNATRRPVALKPAAAAGNGRGTEDDTTAPAPNGALPVLPRLWMAQLQAQGHWIHQPRAQRYGWQGRLDRLLLDGADRTPVLATSTSTSTSTSTTTAAAAARPTTPPVPWLQLLQPTEVRVLRDTSGLQVGLGATRVALLESRLALDEFDWQQGRAATPSATPAGRANDGRTDRLQLRARLEPLPVTPWLLRIQPGFGWGGDLKVAGDLAVRATPEHVQIDAEMRRDSGDLTVTETDSDRQPQRLGLAGLRLALSAHDGQWVLSQSISGGNLGSLEGRQVLQTTPQAWAPGLASPVQGQIDLQVAQLGNWGRWLPAGWRLTGRLASQARVGGTLGAPTLSGDLTGEQLAVRNPLQGVDWRDARLKVRLEGETARIETFTVRAGAGSLSATGGAELGAAPRAEINLRADRFALLQRVDRRLVASGDVKVELDARSTVLRGRLRADEGLFDFTQSDAPSLGDDVQVQREERASAEAPTTTSPRSRRSTTVDLRLDLGPALRLKGRGLNTRLAGDLRLSSTDNRLAVQGAINALEGTYAAYGQKLQIDKGLITFSGTPENPRLDIIATRPDLEEVKVGVAVTGTAQNPRIRLFSEPTMSDTDRLSWLLLGRASEGLGRTDLALLQRAAYALLSGERDSPSLVEQIGLNELSVRQSDGDTRETVVTLGKQLSRRWYLGYERSLNAAQGTWQLIYRLGQRYTLRAQSGTDNALDFIWTWKWGEAAGRRPGDDEDEAPPAPATPASAASR